MQQPSFLVAASAALVLCGCAPVQDVLTATAPAGGGNPANPVVLGGVHPDPDTSNFIATPRQQDYLDALRRAGLSPTSDLNALSIGSYICQAHVAGQSDQAVRDFVLPLVRDEFRDSQPDVAVTTLTSRVDDATAAYMRIATERLC